MIVYLSASTARKKQRGNNDNLLTKAQVAEFCGVTQRTIDAWMRTGLLTYYKIGRTVRFLREDVMAHLKSKCLVHGGH